jgi:hypothetical protein
MLPEFKINLTGHSYWGDLNLVTNLAESVHNCSSYGRNTVPLKDCVPYAMYKKDNGAKGDNSRCQETFNQRGITLAVARLGFQNVTPTHIL